MPFLVDVDLHVRPRFLLVVLWNVLFSLHVLLVCQRVWFLVSVFVKVLHWFSFYSVRSIRGDKCLPSLFLRRWLV